MADLSFFLKPLSFLFRCTVVLRKYFYYFFIPPQKFPVKVISVGNITVGGTGKTPFVELLCSYLSPHIKVAILSRGYQRASRGFYKVDRTQIDGAQVFGDEPFMLAIKNPDCSVYVCENRSVGIEKLLAYEKTDVVILDDALQNFAVCKDLEFVILDATEKESNYKFLPEGRARSSIADIHADHILVFTKTNLVPSSDFHWLETRLSSSLKIQCSYASPQLYSVSKQELYTHKTEVASILKDPVFLLSGIGKPANFEALVKTEWDVKVQKHFVFKDHYSFQQKDLESIFEQIHSAPLLITEKDYVKIKFLIESWRESLRKTSTVEGVAHSNTSTTSTLRLSPNVNSSLNSSLNLDCPLNIFVVRTSYEIKQGAALLTAALDSKILSEFS